MIPGRRLVLRLGSLLAAQSTVRAASSDSADLHVVLGADSERQRVVVQALRKRFARLKTSEDVPALGNR